MNHSLITALGAVAVAGTITLAAQTPTPSSPRPQTPAPSTSQPSRSDDKTMTVTGCLKSANSAMDGRTTPGTPSGTASSSTAKFVLTDIDSGATGSGTTTSDPERGGASMANAGKQYTLTADAGVNLAAHLNHKVRVTGRLSDMDHGPGTMTTPDPNTRPGDPATPGAPARPGETSPTGDRKPMDKSQTLAVSSVTMISATCSSTM